MDDLGGGVSALRTWSRVARGMIVIFLLALAVLIASNGLLFFAEVSRGSSSIDVWRTDAYAFERVSVYNEVMAVALGGSVLLMVSFFLLAAVPIAIWIYRAHANLREAGVAELTYSPGWSVGSYFIPLVNFVIPFRAMRELHNRSHGESVWQAHSPVADVTSWWSCHLAAMLVMIVAAFVAMLATIPNLYVVQPPGANTGLFLFSLLLLTGSGAFLYRTIGAVTSAQQQGLHLDRATIFA